MFTPWSEFDRVFPSLDSLRRRLDDAFPEGLLLTPGTTENPRASWQDAGDHLEIVLEVPGFAESDLKVDVNRESVTVSGERAAPVPEGFRALRRERGAYTFSRSYTLPVPIDAENVAATLKNGVLILTLPKQAEVRPRSIPVHVATA